MVFKECFSVVLPSFRRKMPKFFLFSLSSQLVMHVNRRSSSSIRNSMDVLTLNCFVTSILQFTNWSLLHACALSKIQLRMLSSSLNRFMLILFRITGRVTRSPSSKIFISVVWPIPHHSMKLSICFGVVFVINLFNKCFAFFGNLVYAWIYKSDVSIH